MDIFNEIKQKLLDNKSEKRSYTKDNVAHAKTQMPSIKSKERTLKKEYSNILNQEYYSLASLFWYVDIVDDRAGVKMLYAVPNNALSEYVLFRTSYFEKDKLDYRNSFDFYDVASNQLMDIKDSKNKLYKFCDFDGNCNINCHRIDYKDTSIILRPKGYYRGLNYKILEKFGHCVVDFSRPLYVFDPSLEISRKVTIFLSGKGSFRYSYKGVPEERKRAFKCICCDKKTIERMEEETEQNLNQQIIKYGLKDKVLIR